ncbi:hypothetical protein D3C81_1287850 [compost metagenome]
MGGGEALPYQAGEAAAGQVQGQAADAEALEIIQPIQVTDAEAAAHLGAAIAGTGALGQAALENLDQAALTLRETDLHRGHIVAAGDGDGQGRGALVTIAVLDGVTEGEFDALPFTQPFQLRPAITQLKAVAAIGIQAHHAIGGVHLQAVDTGVADLPGHELERQIGSGIVVIQHIALQTGFAFRHAPSIELSHRDAIDGFGFDYRFFIRGTGRFGREEFRNESNGAGRKANAGVHATCGLAQQHEGVPAAGVASART